MPSRATLAALALLVALAGCVGPGGPATGTATQTQTATPTQTPSETPASPTTGTAGPGSQTQPPSPTPGTGATTTATYSDCPGYLSVDPVSDAPADATVHAYADLSTDRRAEFDAARSEGSAELEQGGDGYEFWVDRPYVRYDGTVYRGVVAIC